MHRRPSAAVAPPPLPALSLPPRPREMSALLSANGSAPHTPTKRAEALPLFTTNTNRYSTDSWNSSNFDVALDPEAEWKPEQLRLLTRTLDALPSHLLTPFNGPVPPSNLLDKIARGVADAKGDDWPHSLRATRAKIVELARVRAKDSSDGSSSDTIAEEDSTGTDAPLQQTTNTGRKRPLHRQSSMDFLQSAKKDIKDNANISRLSRRLQKTDRILTSPHYKSQARSPSPRRGPLSLNPSTPSSSTLHSGYMDVMSSNRKSLSSMSNISDQPVAATRRMRRSDTFTSGGPGLKRAPSFGSSRNSMESVAMSIDFNAKNSDVTSSDEEEKVRTKNAKRARRKASSPTPVSSMVSSNTLAPKTATRAKAAPKTPSKSTTKSEKPVTQSRTRTTRHNANLQRNPSMFGGELPNPQPTPEPPTANRKLRSHQVSTMSPALSTYSPAMDSPYSAAQIPPVTPASVPSKSVRRARHTAPLPRAALARKISFSNMTHGQEENISGGGAGLGLGSAFQLH